MTNEEIASAAQELEPYIVKARNLVPDSENRIHEDSVARQFGFRGGLVPGITTYAYMTRPVAEAWGRDWLERGSLAVKLIAPVYDGDPVVVHAQVEEDGSDAARMSLRVVDPEGTVCATGTATLPSSPATPPGPEEYDEAPLPPPDQRPEATPEAVEGLTVLGTVRRTFHADRAVPFLDAIDDDLDLYRDGAIAHPGWIVWDANQALAQNVDLGPWIHVATEAQHFSLVGD
ncbi:MAG TPA: hypothetical protein VI854_03480, partial [Acidimicrobiia bacterium]|nr:hypothetical protein [Acidimicrobiia bacterium]